MRLRFRTSKSWILRGGLEQYRELDSPGAFHVGAAAVLLNIRFAVGTLLGHYDDEVDLDLVLKGLSLPLLDEDAGHGVVVRAGAFRAEGLAAVALHPAGTVLGYGDHQLAGPSGAGAAIQGNDYFEKSLT